MASTLFRPATRKKVRGRIALDGPSGAGKTFTGLRLAFAFQAILNRQPRVAVINTESGAVEKYLNLSPDGIPWTFDICELADFSPDRYTEAMLAAAAAHYDVLLIDSLSHAWAGVGGALEQVDRRGGNSYTAWKDVTPLHNRMVDAILRSPCHVIVTMRSKMEYVLEESVNRNGKTVQVPRKIGMAPVQRAGMEYEFDVVADMDWTHTLTISKSRCPDLDGQVSVKPGSAFFEPLIRWLNEGSEVDPAFYIATEEDLRKSEEARKAAAAEIAGVGANGNGHPAIQKPSAKELMRQKLAERSSVVPAASTDDGPSAASGVSQNQVQASDASPAAVTAPAGAPEAHAGGVSTTTVAAATGNPKHDHLREWADRERKKAADDKAENNGFATRTQVKRIMDLFERLGVDADARTRILEKRQVQSPRSLSLQQADDLISALVAKEIGLKK